MKAIFISRTSAHLAAIKVGRELGMNDETIAKYGRAHIEKKRGEVLGYSSWLPVCPHTPSFGFKPIMEAQLWLLM